MTQPGTQRERSWILGLLAVLLGVDAALTGAHFASGGAALFSLGGEKNLPTWWESCQFVALAWTALNLRAIALRSRVSFRWMVGGWAVLAALFGFLSLSETARLSARLARVFIRSEVAGGLGMNLRAVYLAGDAAKDGSVAPLLLAPLVVLALTLVLAQLVACKKALGNTFYVAVVGLGLATVSVVSVPLSVIGTPPMALWDVGARAQFMLAGTFGGLAKLVGTSLLLWVLVRFWWRSADASTA